MSVATPAFAKARCRVEVAVVVVLVVVVVVSVTITPQQQQLITILIMRWRWAVLASVWNVSQFSTAVPFRVDSVRDIWIIIIIACAENNDKHESQIAIIA
jgi:hypothetical protein